MVFECDNWLSIICNDILVVHASEVKKPKLSVKMKKIMFPIVFPDFET